MTSHSRRRCLCLIHAPARRPEPGAERRYYALRAFFVERGSAVEVAAALGYSPRAVEALGGDFRAGRREFLGRGPLRPRAAAPITARSRS